MTDTTFGPQLFPNHSPPRLQILISNLSHNVPITVFLDSNPSLPDAFETQLISSWPSQSAPEQEDALGKILVAVRTHYKSHPPGFCLSPFLYTHAETGELTISERTDPCILSKLALPKDIIPANLQHPLPKLYPLSSLYSCPLSPHSPRSYSSQIQLVTLPHSSKLYIAKGPSSRSSFSELHTLLTLPHHPHIIPPPCGLITTSSTDHHIVGFLLEYYPQGNLDSLSLHPSPQTLWSWGRQLVTAAHWLHLEQGTFHGDIKPDNIVLSESGQIVLIDFTQDASTAATAPPEAHGSTFVKTWGREKLEKAEVYAIGRTLWILAKGWSMHSLYMERYRDTECVYETDLEGVSGRLRDVVEMCTRFEPEERPGLEELRAVFEAEGGKRLNKRKEVLRRTNVVNVKVGLRRLGGVEEIGAALRSVREVLVGWGGARK